MEKINNFLKIKMNGKKFTLSLSLSLEIAN